MNFASPTAFTLLSRVVETMNTNFHRAVIDNGVYLKCPGNKFSGYFAADVVLDALYGSLPRSA